ncbi:MAG: methylamine---corrinoid protein Co-methyltransferase [Clostridia bacterium]|nr:methylamine---corrinoid protein Co-methyltransferase [Clostridia bacterium]
MSYRMWEVMERANTGPFMEEHEFLYKRFIPKMREVIKKYNIKYDPQHPVPSDDSLADAVWQAAVEFFREVGVYNQDTHRVILFSDEEIKEALYSAPSSYVVGEGKDSRVFGHRKVEDTRPPFCIYSPDITYDEVDHLAACIAYLKEPLLDGLCAPLLEEFMGRKIQAWAPFELGGSLEHAMSLREACRLVGRPGVFLVAVGTAESDAAQISVSDPTWGVRTTDSRLVGSITEMMTNNSMMNKAAHYNMYGCFTGSLTGAIFGGYAGGAEGTAVLETAYHLKGLMVHQCNYQQNFPFHLKHGSNTGREMLWIVSVYSQAIARNTHLVQDSNGFGNAGPGTEMILYEAAAHSLTSTVSGANLWEHAPAHNKYHNRGTPLECRLAAEVGHAVANMGMKREQANEIANRLLAKYEHLIPEAPLGKTFQELYDVRKAIPRPEWLDMYYRVKEELAGMGLEFPF